MRREAEAVGSSQANACSLACGRDCRSAAVATVGAPGGQRQTGEAPPILWCCQKRAHLPIREHEFAATDAWPT